MRKYQSTPRSTLNNLVAMLQVVTCSIVLRNLLHRGKLSVLALQAESQDCSGDDTNNHKAGVGRHCGNVARGVETGVVHVWRVDLSKVAYHVGNGECGSTFLERARELNRRGTSAHISYTGHILRMNRGAKSKGGMEAFA